MYSISLTNKRHTFKMVILSALLVAFGGFLLTVYWSRDSVHQLKIEHFFATNLNGINVKEAEAKVDAVNAQEVPVLLYHGILRERKDDFNISKDEFRDQMVELKKAGYSTIDMQTYIKFINGDVDLPEKSLLITFDDGRKDSYYRADPVLKALGFQAVMFLTSGDSIVEGSNYYIDKHELKTMDDSGRWDIEAHANYGGTRQIKTSTDTYGNFFGNLRWLDDEGRLETNDEYKERVSNELKNSKSKLEAYLGNGKITAFAYPFGDYAQASSDDSLTDTLLESTKEHYEQAFVQFRTGEPYSSNYRGIDSLISRRIEVDPNLRGTELVDLLGRSTAKAIPYSATLSQQDGWTAEWGKLGFEADAIKISSTPTSTSGAVYLDGTRNMSSYSTTAHIKAGVAPEASIKLVALYNKKRYVGCSYSANEVRIESLANGKRSILVSKPHDRRDLNNSDISVAVDTAGNVKCALSGRTLIDYAVEGYSGSGGPAIIVWHPSDGKATVSIDRFSIENAEYTRKDKF